MGADEGFLPARLVGLFHLGFERQKPGNDEKYYPFNSSTFNRSKQTL
jgi:hypothetical protein